MSDFFGMRPIRPFLSLMPEQFPVLLLETSSPCLGIAIDRLQALKKLSSIKTDISLIPPVDYDKFCFVY